MTYVVELHHNAEDFRTVHLVPVDEVGAWAEDVVFTSRPVPGRELQRVSPLDRDLFVIRLFDEPISLGAHGEWFADQELTDGPWVTPPGRRDSRRSEGQFSRLTARMCLHSCTPSGQSQMKASPWRVTVRA